MKPTLKQKAIGLRKLGKTYSEILREVPVAKSTLSLWLRSIGLSEKHKQRLTEKKRAAALRGSQAKRLQRINRTKQIKEESLKQISKIRIDEQNLWLMGIMLYWAEGDKEKDYRSGARVGFSNSDPYMIRLFLTWVNKSLNISNDRISFRIHVHEKSQYRIDEIKQYWADKTGFSIDRFDKITLKRHNLTSSRKNKGLDYHGLVRINISKSTDLNSKISGWIEGINIYCPVV